MHNSIRVRLETSIQLADYFFSRAAALSRSATVLSFSRARSGPPAIHPSWSAAGAGVARGGGRASRGDGAGGSGGPHSLAGPRGETGFLLLAPISLLSPAIFLRVVLPPALHTHPALPSAARALPSPLVLLLYFNQLILRNAYIYCALSDGGIRPPPSSFASPSPPPSPPSPIPSPSPASSPARVADQPAF